MKNTILVLLILVSGKLVAQNRSTVFYDSAGQLTTFEGHWAQVVTGRYKSVYHKSENKKTLVKTTSDEFQHELRKTEKRITKSDKLGTNFPDFDVYDLGGTRFTKVDLAGKVIVLNFWFIGCAPCEMERPSLNELTTFYKDNTDVVFISFARNNKEELRSFLSDHPVLFAVIPTNKDFMKTNFDVNEYPVNIIVGRDGKYFFNSAGSGVGIGEILQKHIKEAERVTMR